MFLRKSRLEPLPVTMSAVRMGERVLQVGVDDAAHATAIAAKVGLSGGAAIVVTDEKSAERARAAAAAVGVLVDIHVDTLTALAFLAGSFDLVIANDVHGTVSSLDAASRVAAMREWHRVLRPGGRVMAIEEGNVGGLKGLLRKPAAEATAGDETVAALEAAGFRPVRVLAEREGFRFVEGFRG